MLQRLKSLRQRRVVRDGFWVASGQALSALVLLIAARVTTELVPDTGIMGRVMLILGIVTLVRNILFAPILQAQLRFYSDSVRTADVHRLRRVTTRTLARTALPLAGLMAVTGAAFALYRDESVFAYTAPVVLLLVESARTYEVTFLLGARRQKVVTAIGVADTVARPLFMSLAVLWLGPSPQTVMWGYAIGSTLALLAMYVAVHREGLSPDAGHDRAPAGADEDRRLARDLWRYALPIIPLAVVGWITSISDRYVLGWLLGAEEVGVYAMTYALISQPFMMAHGVIGRTLTPIYYQAVADGNPDLERRSFRPWLAGTIAVSLLGVLAIWLLKDWIARLLLAPEYHAGIPLMPWIAAGYMMYGIGTVFEARLYALKLTRRVLLGHSIVAAASIVVPVAFLYSGWGVLGVAMACPAYFGIMVIVMIVLSRGGRLGHPGTPAAAATGTDP